LVLKSAWEADDDKTETVQWIRMLPRTESPSPKKLGQYLHVKLRQFFRAAIFRHNS